MPLYEFSCPKCQAKITEYRPVEDYKIIPLCSSCNVPTKRVYTVPHVHVVSSNIKKVEKLARQEGSIISEPGLDKDAKRNKEYKEKEYKDKIKKNILNTLAGA